MVKRDRAAKMPGILSKKSKGLGIEDIDPFCVTTVEKTKLDVQYVSACRSKYQDALRLNQLSLGFLCAISVLSVPRWLNKYGFLTTETQRAQRLHRENLNTFDSMDNLRLVRDDYRLSFFLSGDV